MTFTIVAKDKRSLGVGVASGSIAVGWRVPWIKSGVGAVATQGYTETGYGKEGLRLLEHGLEPEIALKRLLRLDSARERRQVAFLDIHGRKAIHTGSACPGESGSFVGKNFVCLGNMLENEESVHHMAAAFQGKERFPEAILEALKVGSKSGGDRRGERSSALLIRGKINLVIKVDSHTNPIKKLKQKYDERIPL